jgi:hypothetical protein
MILLDTDHLSVLRFRSGERSARLIVRMEAARDELFGTTIVNDAEQLKGWLAVINKERQPVRQVTGYRELARLFDFYSSYYTGRTHGCMSSGDSGPNAKPRTVAPGSLENRPGGDRLLTSLSRSGRSSCISLTSSAPAPIL